MVDEGNELIEQREAPEGKRDLEFKEFLAPVVSEAQLSVLTGVTPAYAIKTRQGKGGHYRYIPHGYVIDTLNKAFGLDWDFELQNVLKDGIYAFNEITIRVWANKSKTQRVAGWVEETTRNITVMGKLTLRVHNPKKNKQYDVIATIIKTGIGSQDILAGMEFGDAVKGAASDAIKRAAAKLGIGNDLYWDHKAVLAEWEENNPQVSKLGATLKPETEIIEGSVIVDEYPQNFVQLLTKAMPELGMNADAVLTKLDMTMEEINISYTSYKEGKPNSEDNPKGIWAALKKE